MTYIVIALLLSLVALIVAYVQNYYNYWKHRNVPHETPTLGLGNMKGIGRTVHFRDINRRIYKRFKGTTPFVGMFFFFKKTAFIIDLELIKKILIKDFANFHDRGIFSNVRDDPLTGHLLTLEGEQWRFMRAKLSPTFTSGKMKFMFPTVVEVATNLEEACTQLAQQNDEGALELKELCARYTTDVIGTCAFGIECNSLHDPNAEFRRKGRSIFGQPRHSQVVQAFLLAHPELGRRLHMKFFPDDVSEFFISAVRRTVAYRQEHDIKRNDFMDMLIEMKAKNEDLPRQDGNIDMSQGLTLEQMAAQAFVFFLAGFDTSSTTMSFCLYELALNATIQERLRKEIMQALEKHGGVLNYECMSEMLYLEQVLAETLRKYPLLPHLIRQALDDYPVPGTKHIIERGTTIIVPVDVLHHDADLYPEPDKFDPERFTPAAILERHPCAYLPFGDGPRNCIGMRFGKMQAKIGLIMLLRCYTFSKSSQTEVPLVLNKKGFLIEAKNGIFLKIEKNLSI